MPPYDSFLFHEGQGIKLQITIAPTHSLNPDGLSNLRKRLVDPSTRVKKPWLIAIVPEGQTLGYTPRPNESNLREFEFFKMEIKLPDGVLLSLTWPLTLMVS